MENRFNIKAIITAGGSGKRMNHRLKKQFIKLFGRPILFWTIDKFIQLNCIDKLIITLPKEDMIEVYDLIAAEYNIKKFKLVAGGKERQDSVLRALQSCNSKTDIVLIHDAVRPFITKADIIELIEICKQQKAVILAKKVKNTLKTVKNKQIVRTIDRSELYHAYTPQAFDFRLIKYYHEKARRDKLHFTDDAAILENFGQKVYILVSDTLNFKITDKNDLELARLLINKENDN